MSYISFGDVNMNITDKRYFNEKSETDISYVDETTLNYDPTLINLSLCLFLVFFFPFVRFLVKTRRGVHRK